MAFIEYDENGIPMPFTRRPGSSNVGTPATPPPPPAYVPGQVSVGGGPQPDYGALIKGSATYKAWETDRDRRLGIAQGQRGQALRALVLRYGGLPKDYVDKYGDLSAADIQAGAENPYNEKAMIQKGYEQGMDAMKRSLAARGMLGSGELGYGTEQADFQRGQAEYQTGTEFQSAMNQVLGGYSTYEGDVLGEENEVMAGIEPGIIEQYRPEQAQPATLVANSQQVYGANVYRDQSGNLWILDPATGQPVPFTPSGGDPGSTPEHTNPALLLK